MKKLIVIVSFFLVIGFSEKSLAQCGHPDYPALMELYYATNGPGWEINCGWKEGAAGTNCDPSTWYGVTCNAQGRVISISFEDDIFAQISNKCKPSDYYGNLLIGYLPDLNLPYLEHLNLGSNRLQGPIPDLSKVPRLTSLFLDGNKFSGGITNFSFLPKLRYLRLDRNLLSGAIPRFQNCLELFELGLSQNKINPTLIDYDLPLSLGILRLADCGLTELSLIFLI